MKKINSELILSDYAKMKNLAKICFVFKLYSWVMDIIHSAARIMYGFNIIYYDEDLENMLQDIARKKIKNSRSMSPVPKRVVFYDYFSLDNRGLTEQYIQGLIDNDYEILYITLKQKNDNMEQILKTIGKYQKAVIYFVKSKGNFQKCNEIIDEILCFKPSKILYHSAPWDTVGFVIMAYLEAYEIERYLINLTDHAFWLGRNCSDYFLEFRSYGVNISINHRRIKSDRLLILPYYPVQNSDLDFQGFPFDAKEKKIIVSGGSLYKIYGDTIFFDIVKWILEKYKDSLFFYLGNGDTKPLYEFIKRNNFRDQFFYSKERKDINEIIKRCYFYLGTYPILGGLMSQFAAANQKIPVAYTAEKYKMNNIDELFINNDAGGFTFYTLDVLYDEIDKLMTNKKYYSNKTDALKNKVISKTEFAKQLKFIFEHKKSCFVYKKYDIDIDSFSNLYIDQENYYLHNYEGCFMIQNPLICILFPRYSIKKIYKKLITLLN
jgi:hypothetical protein